MAGRPKRRRSLGLPPGPGARNYKWPAFTEANTAGLVHGVYSERTMSAAMERHRPGLLAAAPWLEDLTFTDSFERYIRADARARLAHEHVMRVAAERGIEAVPRYLWDVVNAADRLAANLAGRLGLDPAGKAAVVRDASLAQHFAPDLARLWAAETAPESQPAGRPIPGSERGAGIHGGAPGRR